MDLELLTTGEVAQLLRVSSETVLRLAAAGKLHGRKVGRAWRFPRQAVQDYFCRETTGITISNDGNPSTAREPS
jgi:excisionase family DNA binding protein